MEQTEQRTQQRTQEHLKQKLALLPAEPGCYLMKNKMDEVIYVGKANVLKDRVRSYFTGSHSAKTQRLVMDICDFEYIITSNQIEALILECNLIKQYRPRYNVLLKDDKSFPYIKITNERHPRLMVTRSVVKDNAKYFGPYPNSYAAKQTKKLLDRLYPLRKCTQMPDKVCLYYHIHQCLAPCVYDVTPAENEKMVGEIIKFLNGGHAQIEQELTEKMYAASEALDFERAKEFRDQISHIHAVMQKQAITAEDRVDRDIFAYEVKNGWMSVQILYLRQGKMIERHASTFLYYGDEIDDFVTFVTQYYSENPALPHEINLPEIPSELVHSLEQWLKVKVHIPKRGRKRRLLDLALRNAEMALEEKLLLMEKDEKRTVGAAKKLGEWLGIENLRTIEAFDNSNIQGTDAVSAMVMFTDGQPNQQQYRKYKIKTVRGADDYESMREVIRRRYVRLLKENAELPDLIIVDGGKGQISSALEVLEDELGLSIPVCGLVKNDRHKTSELLYGENGEIVPIPRGSQEFYLLHRIQDEVHRFAITFHRATRSKSLIASKLDAIPGVGEARKKRLLKHFGSIKKIKEASIEQFREISIGEKLARTILAALEEDSSE